MPIDREAVDAWFPVYLRYLGSLLAIVLVLCSIAGVAGVALAPAYVAVTGMIAYKTVHDFGRDTSTPTPVPAADAELDQSIEEAALRAAKRRRGRP